MPGRAPEANGQGSQRDGVVARAAETLREALELAAYFGLAQEAYPKAEFMVLREGPLGQVR
jgi:hypothetical protein